MVDGFTVTLTNPERTYDGSPNGASADVAADVTLMDFNDDFQTISSVDIILESDVLDKYSQSTLSTNPIQENSILLIQRTLDAVTRPWFRGYVHAKPMVQTDAGNVLHVQCYGKDGVLEKALCRDQSGNYRWTLETSSWKVENMPLQPTDAYGTFQGSTLWPDPGNADGAKCYIKDASSNSDTLDTTIDIATPASPAAPMDVILITIYDITGVNQGNKTFTVAEDASELIDGDSIVVSVSTGNDGTYTVASTSGTGPTVITVDEAIPDSTIDGKIAYPKSRGLAPRGWLKINSEWMYYDGYDDDEADNKYRCRVTARAQLGTSAATHTAGATVYEKVAKQIAPCNIVLEVDDGTGYEKVINGKQFKVNASTGFFIYVETTTDTWRGTYSVYDEDKSFDAGSTVISLADIVTAILKSPVEYGGAGFSDSDLDFSVAVNNILVNRYDYDPTTKPQYAWQAIQELIATIGYEEEIQFWYKHYADKFRLAVVGNSASVCTVPFVEVWNTEKSLDDVNSICIVEYRDDQSINSATVDHCWHQAAAGSGNSPDRYEWSTEGGSGFDFPNNGTSTSAGTDGLQYAVDGRDDTKVAGWFTHSPTGDFIHSHWWFGAGTTPPVVDLDRIIAKINNYRTVDSAWQPFQNSNATYLMRIDGCDDYNSSTHSGTWQELGCFMTGEPSVNGLSVKGDWNAFLMQRVNAIRIVWEYMAGPKTATSYYGVIHELFIETNTVKFAEVQLTDQAGDKGDSTKIYAPDTFRKLRGGINASHGVAGCQRPIWHRIGASSDGAAISLARTLLKTNLVMYESKRGEYTGPLPVKPDLGATVVITENVGGATYEGVMRTGHVTVSNDEIRATADVYDYNASVIT